jgi:hypothetical protein
MPTGVVGFCTWRCAAAVRLCLGVAHEMGLSARRGNEEVSRLEPNPDAGKPEFDRYYHAPQKLMAVQSHSPSTNH